MDATPTSTSRRRVVQGLAWAAPAVAMTAAAPAFATSPAKCTPTVSFSGSVVADWGKSNAPATVQLAFGGQVSVAGLPADVTVTGVTERYFIQNAVGQNSTDGGLWFMGNSRTNWARSGQCTDVGCSVQWTRPIGKAATTDYTTKPGSDSVVTGWSSTVKNTVNNEPTVFPDKISKPAWDAILTWSPSTKAGNGLTPRTDGCVDFTTGPSGLFGVNYFDTPPQKLGVITRVFAVVTITLSKGDPLTYTTKMSPITVKYS